MIFFQRFLLLCHLPGKMRALRPGTFIEVQIDEPGRQYVIIGLEDFNKLAAAAGANMRERSV